MNEMYTRLVLLRVSVKTESLKKTLMELARMRGRKWFEERQSCEDDRLFTRGIWDCSWF